MRYSYTLKMDDLECQCENVEAVAEAINGRAGCAVATVHTVNSLFSRPHKANKRLFGPGKIEVERERHLTKAEQEQAKARMASWKKDLKTNPDAPPPADAGGMNVVQ